MGHHGSRGRESWCVPWARIIVSLSTCKKIFKMARHRSRGGSSSGRQKWFEVDKSCTEGHKQFSLADKGKSLGRTSSGGEVSKRGGSKGFSSKKSDDMRHLLRKSSKKSVIELAEDVNPRFIGRLEPKSGPVCSSLLLGSVHISNETIRVVIIQSSQC